MAAPDLDAAHRRRRRRRPAAPGVHRLPSGALHRGAGRADAPAARRADDRGDRARVPRRRSRRSPSASSGPSGRSPRRRSPSRFPAATELHDRLSSVLEVIYLIFNEGYAATAGDDWMRPALCEEALRLGRILAELAPEEPEVHGLVALMEIQASRLAGADRSVGRADPAARPEPRPLGPAADPPRPGGARPRRDSSAAPWPVRAAGRDRRLPRAGADRRRRPTGRASRRSTTRSAQLTPSPVVELNRAVAVGMAFGPAAGLELVDALTVGAVAQELSPAAQRARRPPGQARAASTRPAREFERAASLTRNARERTLLLDAQSARRPSPGEPDCRAPGRGAGREVADLQPATRCSSPSRSTPSSTSSRYYLAVADGALRGAGGRPNVLVRYPNGIGGEFFYQKRAPASRPPWIEVVSLRFPSGRSADEVVPRDAAALAWLANLACLELHPHPVRADDLDHPDELRVDLDPVPGVEWSQVREVAQVVEDDARGLRAHRLAQDLGLARHARQSCGSSGAGASIEVRRAALALAREVERRAPDARHQQVVEGGAPRRVRGLQPERQGPHRRLGLLGAAQARRPGVGAAHAGTRCRAPSRRDFTLATMPARFAEHRRPRTQASTGMPDRWSACSSCRRSTSETGWATRPGRRTTRSRRASRPRVQPSKRRTSKHPLIEIGRAQRKEDALAGLERWKARHPEAAAHLEPADVLVDAMRGRSTTWTRIRVNLQHVPAELRPAQEPLDPDEKTLSSS